MQSGMDLDRLLINWKTASALGVAAALSVGGTILIRFDLFNLANLNLSQSAFKAVSLFGAASAIGAFTLIAAMWVYFVKCDISSKRIRTVWFIVLLFGLYAGIGSVAYYLAVYLPRVKRGLQDAR